MQLQTKRWALVGALVLVVTACGGATEVTTDSAPTSTTVAMEDAAMGTGDMDSMDDMENGEHDHEHEHEPGAGREWAGSAVPTVDVTVESLDGGWLVSADIGDTFQFGVPEEIEHVDGVGHAHLVIDGAVAQMIYAPTVTIDSLEPGPHMIEVRLASSDHTDYVSGGAVVGGMTMIEVPGAVAAADVEIAASFEDGSVIADSARIEVAVGDLVEIVVNSDVTEEIHVHGYDLFAEVDQSSPATLRFTAEVPGIFEVEFEKSGALIVELVIS